MGKFCFDLTLETVDNNADANKAIEAKANEANMTDKADKAFEASQ
jgi:hypothetical protein